jgi:hypothetical protein
MLSIGRTLDKPGMAENNNPNSVLVWGIFVFDRMAMLW